MINRCLFCLPQSQPLEGKVWKGWAIRNSSLYSLTPKWWNPTKLKLAKESKSWRVGVFDDYWFVWACFGGVGGLCASGRSVTGGCSYVGGGWGSLKSSKTVFKSKSEQNLTLNTKRQVSNKQGAERKMAINQNIKKRLNVTMAAPYLEGMDLLIKDGLYDTHSEVVKDALRRLFNHYELTCISDCTQ